MIRSVRTMGVGMTALVAGFLLLPIMSGALAVPTSESAPPSSTDVIAVNVRGTGQREASAPNRFVRTVDLYAMTGQKVGTATRDFAFTGPNAGDDVMTFKFGEGQLVSRAVLNFSAASSNPGFFFVATHSQGSSVVPERGTGAYAGRTGRLRMAGWHDGRAFPEQATFDDFFVIELDR